jgi:hypothetical protein
MPHDFDAELPQDLSFIAGGETFTMKLVDATILAKYEDEEAPETAAAAVERLRARLVDFLAEGDRERWETLVASGTVPYRTMNRIATWAWEVQTGRPTTPPPDSGSGRGGTGATSTDVSRSRAARARVKAGSS